MANTKVRTKKIMVTDKDTLNKLYDNSALTIEGLSESSIPDFLNWIEELTPIKNKVVYITKGGVMNMAYGLTGSNAYQNDINIVSVMLDDMEDPMAVTLPRFQIGGRWFDDIVDNNARREGKED